MDDNGDPIVVEIDESYYFKPKYQRGRRGKGCWVFGGCERISKKCFLVVVRNRKKKTLQRLIKKHIRPGTHIISDGWAAYADIPTMNHGRYRYTHSVVIHEQHFVDPINADIHTQNIENMWMRAKRKLRRQFGTSRGLFPSYLHEFSFRNAHRDKRRLFSCFLARIRASYQF